MSDTALKSILDREGVFAFMRSTHASTIELLENLVDHGTNLIARAHENSPKDYKATYLLFVHLHQLVVHLDAASLLLKQGCCLSAHLQLRALLENYLFLKWILMSDTDNKVEHIFVADVRRKIKWQSVALPESETAKRHADAAADLNLTPEQIQRIREKVEKYRQVLQDPPSRKAINEAFEVRRAKNKKGYEPYWHSLCGADKIAQIAQQVGDTKHYTYLYGPFSEVTHGGDPSLSIKYRKEGVEVVPIRNADAFERLCQLGATFALNAYLTLTELYLPTEVNGLRHKYDADWKNPYRAIYSKGGTPEAKIDQPGN